MLKEVIRGTGKTCIFFHNSYLSQYALEGKHPSSLSRCIYHYLKFSIKKQKNNQGTLHSNVIYAYSEPSRCFLTVSVAPITSVTKDRYYINLSLKQDEKNK